MTYAKKRKIPVTAYEIAVSHGFKGTEAEWVQSLKGESAYEVSVKNGFKGTEKEFTDIMIKR